MKYFNLLLCFAITLWIKPAYGQWYSGDTITLNVPEHHDVYVAGGQVTINAPVYGDLVVAGGTVIVNDSITQDMLIAGGNVILNGYGGDDVRCATGRLTLKGRVNGDLVITGGNIHLLSTAVVNGNVFSSGSEIIIDGKVNGIIRDVSAHFILNGIAGQTLESKGGKITINGTVNGNSVLAAEMLEIGPNARFNNAVRFWCEAMYVDFKTSLQGHTATYDPALKQTVSQWQYLGYGSFMMVMWYLGTAFVMIVLIQLLFRNMLERAAVTIRNSSLKSLGTGILLVIAVPVAIVIFFVSVITIPVALLTLIAFVTLILLATIIVALLIASWVNVTYYQSKWTNGKLMLIGFSFFVCLKLATLTPFIGPVIMGLLACMAFGGLLLSIRKHAKQVPAAS